LLPHRDPQHRPHKIIHAPKGADPGEFFQSLPRGVVSFKPQVIDDLYGIEGEIYGRSVYDDVRAGIMKLG
jgi:hypothetical protein